MHPRQIWINLMNSLWFVPGVIVLGAIGLAVGLVGLDLKLIASLSNSAPLIFGVGAEGSRATLSAIAGSMITVAGVVFSITIVALSLASNQYSPRVLRNFMSDRVNQTVLGVFVGVFVYCLLVLRTIRDGSTDGFVPVLAVLAGVLLALVGMGFLIFFIHHIAASIQAAQILSAITKETVKSIDRLFPESLSEDEDEAPGSEVGPIHRQMQWHVVPARSSGYVQTVDMDDLVEAARKRAIVVRMERGTGEFVVEDTPLAFIGGPDAPDDGLIRLINDAYTLNRQRTVEQDPAFGIRQIVDMAIKALSPGINDTTTAVMCTDYLTVILVRLCRRRNVPCLHFDGEQLRLIARGPSFEFLLGRAVDQIRQSAEGNVTVVTGLLRMLEQVAGMTDSTTRRRMLRDKAVAVLETARMSIQADTDRAAVNTLVSRLVALTDPEAVNPSGELSCQWRI